MELEDGDRWSKEDKKEGKTGNKKRGMKEEGKRTVAEENKEEQDKIGAKRKEREREEKGKK